MRVDWPELLCSSETPWEALAPLADEDSMEFYGLYILRMVKLRYIEVFYYIDAHVRGIAYLQHFLLGPTDAFLRSLSRVERGFQLYPVRSSSDLVTLHRKYLIAWDRLYSLLQSCSQRPDHGQNMTWFSRLRERFTDENGKKYSSLMQVSFNRQLLLLRPAEPLGDRFKVHLLSYAKPKVWGIEAIFRAWVGMPLLEKYLNYDFWLRSKCGVDYWHPGFEPSVHVNAIQEYIQIFYPLSQVHKSWRGKSDLKDEFLAKSEFFVQEQLLK